MQLQRAEAPNNTPEQVRAYVDAALALMVEIDPPEELREAVFRAAYDGFSGKSVVMAQPEPVALGHLVPNARGR